MEFTRRYPVFVSKVMPEGIALIESLRVPVPPLEEKATDVSARENVVVIPDPLITVTDGFTKTVTLTIAVAPTESVTVIVSGQLPTATALVAVSAPLELLIEIPAVVSPSV